MNLKTFPTTFKTNEGAGTFTGIASVYGNKDLQGDIVDHGAFTKTLSERGATVPILWQHDPSAPIGRGTLTDTPAGLKLAGKLSLGTSKGKDAYELLKDGVVMGLSIGYDTVKQKFVDGARHLQELKLYEVSCVTFPANEDALIAAVKAGRRISAATRQQLSDASDHLAAGHKALDAVLASNRLEDPGKSGRVLSATNHATLAAGRASYAAAHSLIDDLLASTRPDNWEAIDAGDGVVRDDDVAKTNNDLVALLRRHNDKLRALLPPATAQDLAASLRRMNREIRVSIAAFDRRSAC